MNKCALATLAAFFLLTGCTTNTAVITAINNPQKTDLMRYEVLQVSPAGTQVIAKGARQKGLLSIDIRHDYPMLTTGAQEHPYTAGQTSLALTPVRFLEDGVVVVDARLMERRGDAKASRTSHSVTEVYPNSPTVVARGSADTEYLLTIMK